MQLDGLELAQRLETDHAQGSAAYVTTLKRLLPSSTAEVLSVGEWGKAVYLLPESPINRASGIMSLSEIQLNALEAFYKRFHAPVQLNLHPYADSAALALIAQRGYRITQFLNRHVRALAAAETFPEPPTGITVERIPPTKADLFAFTAHQRVAGDDKFTLAHLTCQTEQVACYLARVDSEIAGHAAMSINGRLATLFFAGTHPDYRQLGVQMALIQARLRDAAQAGCDLATASSIPGTPSERNIRRAGFRMVYTQMTFSQSI